MTAKLAPVDGRLLDAIKSSWSRDTSYDPDAWSSDNPAWGQCAVAALVVQDYLGGDLLRVTDGHVTHYWNRVESGDVDLTLVQFSSTPAWTSSPEVIERAYVLSWPDTRVRYNRLRDRVADLLTPR